MINISDFHSYHIHISKGETFIIFILFGKFRIPGTKPQDHGTHCSSSLQKEERKPAWRRFHGKESSPVEAIRELG